MNADTEWTALTNTRLYRGYRLEQRCVRDTVQGACRRPVHREGRAAGRYIALAMLAEHLPRC